MSCFVRVRWSTRDGSGSIKRARMNREAIIAIGIGLTTGYTMFVITGVFGAGLSTAIGLGLGSFFWLRGRKSNPPR